MPWESSSRSVSSRGGGRAQWAPATTTYWVDGVSGLDTNPGTQASPFRRISVAIGIANAQAPAAFPIDIRVRGRLQPGSTTQAYEYTDGNGEAFPYMPAPRIRFTYDQAGSDTYPSAPGGPVPAVIRSSIGGGNGNCLAWIFNFEASGGPTAGGSACWTQTYDWFDPSNSGIDGTTTNPAVKGIVIRDGNVGIMPFAVGYASPGVPRVVDITVRNVEVRGSAVSHYYPDAKGGGRVLGLLDASRLIVDRSAFGAVMEIGAAEPNSEVSPTIQDVEIGVQGTNPVTGLPWQYESGIVVFAFDGGIARPSIRSVTVDGGTLPGVTLPHGIRRGIVVNNSGLTGVLEVNASFADTTVSNCGLGGMRIDPGGSYYAYLPPEVTVSFQGRITGCGSQANPLDPSEGHGVVVVPSDNGRATLTLSEAEVDGNFLDGLAVLLDQPFLPRGAAVFVSGSDFHENGRNGAFVLATSSSLDSVSKFERSRFRQNDWCGFRNVVVVAGGGTKKKSSPTFANNVVYGNGTTPPAGQPAGDGFYNEANGNGARAEPTVVHATITQNAGYAVRSVTAGGGGTSGLTTWNSILYGNNGGGVGEDLPNGFQPSVGVQYCDIGSWPNPPGGQQNINQVPQFVAPLSSPPDFRLQAMILGFGVNSPCIDQAHNSPPGNPPTDFEGDGREYDIPGVGLDGGVVTSDMGFDEARP